MAVEIKGLTKRSEDYSKWYNELVVKADLAEQSAISMLVMYGFFNGIGQCMIPASCSSLIAQYHVKTRSTALSIYQIGLYFGGQRLLTSRMQFRRLIPQRFLHPVFLLPQSRPAAGLR